MQTDLALTTDSPSSRDVSAAQLAVIEIVAKTLVETRYYPIATPSRAAYLMAKVYELGFPATAAPDVIDDIQGRLTLKPQAAWALVLRSGLLEDMKIDEGDDYCEVLFKRKGLPFFHGYKFTRAAAVKAGLVKPDGAYEKWERNMYYWRAMGFAIDRMFPDVTNGMKDSAQFGATVPGARFETPAGPAILTSAGAVIDGETGAVLHAGQEG